MNWCGRAISAFRRASCGAYHGDVESLIASGNTADRRARLVELMRASHNATVGVCGLEETLESIRDEMRKFADSEVMGHAQTWHRTNSYIPLEITHIDSLPGPVPPNGSGMGLDKPSSECAPMISSGM